MASVLVISADWTTRVLVRAQLAAEGLEAIGRLDVRVAFLDLAAEPTEFGAVIFDTLGQADLTPRTLARLASAGPPVLVLTGPSGPPAGELAAAGLRHVLVRPVFVGDVVSAVRALPSGPSRIDRGSVAP